VSCTPGCCSTPAEHFRTLSFADARRQQPKVTTDDHGTHTVDVIEHYHADRQDVTVHAPVVRRQASPRIPGA
jgi:hypothetical protein